MLGKALGRLGTIPCAGLLLFSYLVLLAAGFAGSIPLYLLAGLAAIAGELVVMTWITAPRDFLEKVGIGRIYRHLARDLSVVLLLITAVRPSGPQLSAVLVLLAALWAAAVGSGALAVLVDRRHPVQALTRNIDLGPLWFPPRPPAWASQFAGDRLPYLNALLVPAALVAAAADSVTPVLVAQAVVLAVAAVVGAVVALTWIRGRSAPGRGLVPGQGPTRAQSPVLSALQDWLAAHRPQVAIYSAGPARDVYQVNMWLAPVEALDRPGIVILRSREAFNDLADTRLPVVCVPSSVDFMNVEFGSLRAVLYPANVGANIHMLREPGIKHVFVGHGDSDKQASVNPYSKVYDEVWVAGLAGRERYARAAVGVRDEDIVEVGRPQLDGVRLHGSGQPDRPFTVLYAPTWEGWLDDPHHSSLSLMGESVVRGLLALGPAVRVIYKPHPLTGSRGKDVRAINARIVELIRAAGGEVEATSLDGPGHRVVAGPTPGLFACFNSSDLLISDVSSVVADWVQSQRPYVVANPAGLPEDEFRREYPTARAAYLLSADCGELEKIIELTRGGEDPLREARRELKTYLLGPDEPTSMERFRAEVARLCG